jgi:hypothetical protein
MTAARFTRADRAALVALLREAGDVLCRDKRLVRDPIMAARVKGYVGALLEGLADDLEGGELPIARHKPRLRDAMARWEIELAATAGPGKVERMRT